MWYQRFLFCNVFFVVKLSMPDLLGNLSLESLSSLLEYRSCTDPTVQNEDSMDRIYQIERKIAEVKYKKILLIDTNKSSQVIAGL